MVDGHNMGVLRYIVSYDDKEEGGRSMSKDTPPEDEDKKKKVKEGDERVIYVDFATGRRLSKEEWSKTPEDIADELVGQEPEDFEELAVQNSIKINSLKYVAQRQQDTLDSLGAMSLAAAKLAGATAHETDSNSKEIKTIWSRIMSNVSTKEFRLGVVAIILVIVGLFAWSQSQKPKMPSYVFVASHYASKEPALLDVIRTQAELDSVKKADIYDKELATIGAFVGLRPDGYYVNPKPSSDVVAEDIPDTKTQFDTYTFVPDTKHVIVKPREAHKISTEGELRLVLNSTNIEQNNLAAIGAYVVKRPDGAMVVIGADETLWRFEPQINYPAEPKTEGA